MIQLIKQIPDDYAEAIGLSKYDRSRMPGCKDIFQASESNGFFNTGLTKDVADKYGAKIGKNLSEYSPFWENFRVVLFSDKLKSFDTTVIMDDIAFKMLVANGYVAPSKEDAYTPKYREAQYYAYTEEVEEKDEISKSKRFFKAAGLLLEMSDNREKMLLYGQYLEGIKYNDKFKEDTLYRMLSAYLKEKDENVTLFLEALTMSVEQLQQKIIVDKALKQHIIKRVGIGNKKQVYQFGQITVGSTIDEVYKNLSLPDFAPELMSIKKELDNK